MALTPEQIDALNRAKSQGLTKQQAMAQVFRGVSSQPDNLLKDSFEDVTTAFRDAGTDLEQRGQNIIESHRAGKAGEQTPFETGGQFAGEVLMGAGDLGFRGLQAGVKPFLSQRKEDEIAQNVGGAIQKVDEQTGIGEKIEGLSDRTKRNFALPGGIAEVLTAGTSGTLLSGLRNPLSKLLKSKPTGTPSPSFAIQEIEDVIETAYSSLRKQADDPNLSPRQQEEAANAALTFKEKYIGLTPDVKKRLGEMGPEKLKEYLDAAHLRNIDDTAPTPYEVGSSNVGKAEETLQARLNDTGSGIGQTRQKLSTVKLTQPQVSAIEKSFLQELKNLNLTINNGKVVKIPGKITATEGGDIKALNSLLLDLKTFKQSPTVANAIDLRKNFDGKIKFGKSAREVSNNVDATSRGVRKVIAKEAAKTVGKQNAAELTKYSDFMDAYGDLQSFTNRAAGGEYLLRLVLSGRGGEARKLIKTIKEYTDIDLMHDATAMKVATEALGNESTRNLFKQEVTKAGYDAGAVLSGSPTGILSVVGKRLFDKGIDVEDILLKAAGAGGGLYVASLILDEEDLNASMMMGLMVASTVPTVRKSAVKALAKKADEATIGEMVDFSRVIKEKGVVTDKEGVVTFKEIENMTKAEVKKAWDSGLRLIEIDTKTLDANSQKTPGEIAKFYDEVIAEAGTPKVTDTPVKPGELSKKKVDPNPSLSTEATQPRAKNGQFGKKTKFVPKPTAKTMEKAFSDGGPLSTKLIGKLEGKTSVNKQFISDLTNSPDLKQAERDLIRDVLNDFDGKVNVSEFADKVKTRLVPLKINERSKGRFGQGFTGYEETSLPSDLRGNVANYHERIYESPIKNSAGEVHYPGDTDKYFAHSRIEDMADGQTRRVIEAQSDLFQKGRLESEFLTDTGDFAKDTNPAQFNQIKPYRNTWWERIVREEVSQAAKDGKTTLQFPTGETAMKIEGLGSTNTWSFKDVKTPFGDDVDLTISDLKVGREIKQPVGDKWIITEVLDDGKFKAVPKDRVEQIGREILEREGKLTDDFYEATSGIVVEVENKLGKPRGQIAKSEILEAGFTEKQAQAFSDAGSNAYKNKQKQGQNLVDEIGIEKIFEQNETNSFIEQFDISGKVDTKNPIYRFYEKDMQKYLTKNYGAKQVTDENGVTWVEMNVDPKKGKLPVEAFGLLLAAGGAGAVATQQ